VLITYLRLEDEADPGIPETYWRRCARRRRIRSHGNLCWRRCALPSTDIGCQPRHHRISCCPRRTLTCLDTLISGW